MYKQYVSLTRKKNNGRIIMEENLRNVSVNEMIETFTKSYISKTKEIFDISFGFLIDEKDWYTLSILQDGSYQINDQKPSIPTFYLVTSFEILEKILQGQMHFMTAGGKAHISDYAPLDIRFLDGFKMNADFDLMDFAFHFFVLGEPEKVPFGKEYARIVHGGYAIPLVYSKGLRTGWYRVEKGMIINESPKDQSNPFDTCVIGIKGKGIAKLNDKEYEFKDGETFYIPKYMSHSFYTYDEEGLEFIIIMFGEGA